MNATIFTDRVVLRGRRAGWWVWRMSMQGKRASDEDEEEQNNKSNNDKQWTHKSATTLSKKRTVLAGNLTFCVIS